MIVRRIVPALAAILVASSFAGMPAQAEETTILDPELVQDHIVKNWLLPFDLVEECPEPFRLNVTLQSGIVKDVALDGAPRHGACEALVQSAIRAVRISSPLPVPLGVEDMYLIFDPANTAAE